MSYLKVSNTPHKIPVVTDAIFLRIWHPLLPVFCVVCLTPSNMTSVTTGISCGVFDTVKYGIRYYRYFVLCVWHLQTWHPLLPVFCVVCLTPSNMASVTTGILCGVFDTFKYGIRYYRYFVLCVWHLQIWHPLLPVLCGVYLTVSNTPHKILVVTDVIFEGVKHTTQNTGSNGCHIWRCQTHHTKYR
jgi:hypothetical protein